MKLTEVRIRVLYWLSVTLRAALAIWGTGYIHPDMFFQSGEVLARQVMFPELQDRVATASTKALPWEWQSNTQGASRSVLPMFVLVGVPQLAYRWLGAFLGGAVCLLTVERVWMCYISFLCDAVIWKCIYQATSSTPTADVVRLVWACSWPALTLLSMTFSNTLETALLLLLMLTIIPTSYNRKTHLLVGALTAFGLFTRFTFLAFAAPLGIVWLSRHRSWHALGLAAFSGLVVSLLCIWADTLWFLSPERQLVNILSPSNWVVAPWNNLIYNTKQENLAHHGIHPRITHLAVNFPLLFGGPWTLYCAASYYFARFRANQISSLHKICIAVVCTGLFTLSLAPHQEPRFLLPLLAPVSVLLAPCIRERHSKGCFLQFIVVSLCCTAFFGVLHQGGVTKVLCSSWLADGNQVNDIIFYKTYSPPLHALAGRGGWVRVHDAAGSADKLAEILQRIQLLQHEALVAAPASVELPSAYSNCSSQMMTFGPHVSVEALPTNSAQLSLNVYRIELNR